jgi:uncharacterized damage-inducible protein DinB
MQHSEIETLFGYNYWSNDRVLDAAGRLRKASFIAPAELSHGSVQATLVHVLSVEWVWRSRCQRGISPTSMLKPSDFPTVAALRARWQEEEKAMRAYLETIGDEDLNRKVDYVTTIGMPYQHRIWQILLHVVYHGTQFRGEVAMVLSRKRKSPGDLDLIAYLRERGAD